MVIHLCFSQIRILQILPKALNLDSNQNLVHDREFQIPVEYFNIPQNIGKVPWNIGGGDSRNIFCGLCIEYDVQYFTEYSLECSILKLRNK